MSKWIVISLGSLRLPVFLSFLSDFTSFLGSALVLDLMLHFNDKFCPFFPNFSVICYRLILLDLIFRGLSKASREDENEADSISKSCSVQYELEFLIMLLKIMTSVSVSSDPS